MYVRLRNFIFEVAYISQLQKYSSDLHNAFNTSFSHYLILIQKSQFIYNLDSNNRLFDACLKT